MEMLDGSLGRYNARGMGRQELHSWGSLTNYKYSPSRMYQGRHFQRKMTFRGTIHGYCAERGAVEQNQMKMPSKEVKQGKVQFRGCCIPRG